MFLCKKKLLHLFRVFGSKKRKQIYLKKQKKWGCGLPWARPAHLALALTRGFPTSHYKWDIGAMFCKFGDIGWVWRSIFFYGHRFLLVAKRHSSRQLVCLKLKDHFRFMDLFWCFETVDGVYIAGKLFYLQLNSASVLPHHLLCFCNFLFYWPHAVIELSILHLIGCHFKIAWRELQIFQKQPKIIIIIVSTF